ncbi:glycosyltransferase, partial [Nostoc sp. CHAB 5834]|nr:glycosyltransferase [Nostoc sp. CHAB 5834]
MPRLSIITINFNNAPGLQKTIASVVAQSSKEIEYIIIDGGSTDESVAIIAQYSDKITYWISEPDQGIYQAMNKGINRATGDYCQFLNSGDWLVDNQVVERMLNPVPTCSILVGNLLLVQQNGVIRKDSFQYQEISFLAFYRGTLNHSSAFIKRSLFKTYGLYDESLAIVA